MQTLLGKKLRMSHTFIEGTRVPVTVVETGPCLVTQIKRQDSDGYWAVQLGFGTKKDKHSTKPLLGHVKSAQKDQPGSPRYLREVRVMEAPTFSVGDVITLNKIFRKGDVVTVTGISKGKGFAGVVKRWGFAGGPKTHGQSDRHRAPGSIGQGTTPGRVLKGKKMAGRLGSDRVSVSNLMVVDINPSANELWISGSIPGTKGSLIIVKKTKAGSLEDLVTEAPVVEEQVEEEGAKNSDEPVSEQANA
jgi:large subunit ribosomal protein L3